MSVFVRQNAIEMEYTSDSWVILSPIEQSIKAKIEKYGTPLKDWNISINYGIKTGCNEAFIIDGKKRAELIAEDAKSDEIIRPILRGRDIKRYGYDFADLWLIFIPWHFPLHLDSTITGSSTKAEETFQKEYPAIYNHLLKFKDILSKRNQSETGIRYEWYALQRWGANYWNDFSKQKIVYGQFRRGSFAFDSKGCFLSSNEYFIETEKINLKYLLGVLNSKICYYYGCISMNNLGGVTTIAQKDIFIKFPLLIPSQTVQNQIIAIVDKIIDLKGKGIDNTKTEEEKINQILFDLYSLSEEEIALISSND